MLIVSPRVDGSGPPTTAVHPWTTAARLALPYASVSTRRRKAPHEPAVVHGSLRDGMHDDGSEQSQRPVGGGGQPRRQEGVLQI